MPRSTSIGSERFSTGVPGLDEVLDGGLIEGRTYLVSGAPGTGKTTIGWHFLLADGDGSDSMFVTFGEAPTQLLENARLGGFDASRVTFVDLSPTNDDFARAERYDIFSPAEVEREPTMRRIAEEIECHRPTRIFVDSMTHLRYLASDAFAFRKHALSFLRYLTGRGTNVMVTSESSADQPDDDLRFLCDGVIELGLTPNARTLNVTKFRGSDFRSGSHTLRLGANGATVFPRLLPDTYHRAFVADTLSTGLAGFDEILHGGIERATITLLTGPSGAGKTTLSMQLLKASAARGERAAIYTFDERATTLVARAESVDIPLEEMRERGLLLVSEIEALRFTPDEFANMVRRDVEERETRVVVIDSVSGYRLCVAGDDISRRLHALCKYLQNVGVTVVLVNELAELNDFRISDIGISYLADTVVFLRYIERRGALGEVVLSKGIGVLKKRLSDFDKSLREFTFHASGLVVGSTSLPLSSILRDVPTVQPPPGA